MCIQIIFIYLYINMETPRTNPGLTKKAKLGLLTFAIFSLFASSCNSKSPQDIVSGILTDWDNRRDAEKIWLTYQEYEKASNNPTDTYELRALQREALQRSNELTESRRRWIKELWRAERREDRREHRNNVNGTESNNSDPLNWRDPKRDADKGNDTDESLRSIYFWQEPENTARFHDAENPFDQSNDDIREIYLWEEPENTIYFHDAENLLKQSDDAENLLD